MITQDSSVSREPGPPATSREQTLALLLTMGVCVLITAGFWVFGPEAETDTPGVRMADASPIRNFRRAVAHTDEGYRHHLYLVDSEAQAATVDSYLIEADNVRHQIGLSPLLDHVLVVATQADAERVIGLVNEGNRIVTDFLYELVVVDLRR